jgi:hypothetical protein
MKYAVYRYETPDNDQSSDFYRFTKWSKDLSEVRMIRAGMRLGQPEAVFKIFDESGHEVE